jgi:Ni,Fe-hydrogenase III component G
MKVITKFVDWYIQKNYSDNFIHKDLIADEIEKRIRNAEDRINRKRDTQEENKIKAQQLRFDIEIMGYKAEIHRYEISQEEINKMRKDLINLYYRVKNRAKELSIITALSEDEGNKIISNIAASVGSLEKINLNIDSVIKEIADSEKKDNEILQIEN